MMSILKILGLVLVISIAGTPSLMAHDATGAVTFGDVALRVLEVVGALLLAISLWVAKASIERVAALDKTLVDHRIDMEKRIATVRGVAARELSEFREEVAARLARIEGHWDLHLPPH